MAAMLAKMAGLEVVIDSSRNSILNDVNQLLMSPALSFSPSLSTVNYAMPIAIMSVTNRRRLRTAPMRSWSSGKATPYACPCCACPTTWRHWRWSVSIAYCATAATYRSIQSSPR